VESLRRYLLVWWKSGYLTSEILCINNSCWRTVCFGQFLLNCRDLSLYWRKAIEMEITFAHCSMHLSVPVHVQVAYIIPVLKKAGLDNTDGKNYWYISNLSVILISKMLEHVIRQWLLKHIKVSSLFRSMLMQSAYWKCHSMETVIAKALLVILMALDRDRDLNVYVDVAMTTRPDINNVWSSFHSSLTHIRSIMLSLTSHTLNTLVSCHLHPAHVVYYHWYKDAGW